MPAPRWLAEVNKRVFNPVELKRGRRPVLIHVGRKSGAVHRTPLDAHPVDGGFVFILVYGAGSDWVRNVLASGTAELRVGGDRVELHQPRLADREEVAGLLPDAVKLPPAIMNVTEFLRMDTLPEASVGTGTTTRMASRA